MTDQLDRLTAALADRYKLERQLGVGGMATVYLAEDLKHKRKVAVKVLRPELAAVLGTERFLKEIEVTANLQHPHILPLHDSGEADSFLCYVMPYIDGETLRDKLNRETQLSIDEAVRITTEVADALDSAHQQGVIHRDIKPENILLDDGRPMVADFGIALAVSAAAGGRMTETGLSLGTPHYMSPEQATAEKDLTNRADIYSLGSVLYEMLTGEPPHSGGSAQAIIMKIVTEDVPPVTKVRKAVPPHVAGATAKSLEKLPADRFTSAQEFAAALNDEHFRHGDAVSAGAGDASRRWNVLTTVFAALFVVSALLAGWSVSRPGPAPTPVARFSSPFEEGQSPVGPMQFTPDGTALVYVGPVQGSRQTQLWIRRWAELDAAPIRGTEGALTFSVSPDGQEIAFNTDIPSPLLVVPLEGNLIRTIADSVTVGHWAPDGFVYGTGPRGGLGRVAAAPGAEIEVLTELDGELLHIIPYLLPGGKTVVFQVVKSALGDDTEIWALDLDTGNRWLIGAGSTPKYVRGHLLFGSANGTLVAAPMDRGSVEITGRLVPVAEFLTVGPFSLVNYAVSDDGRLLFQSGGGGNAGEVEMVWVTRSGVATVVDPGWRFEPGGLLLAGVAGWSLSPDGTRAAVTRTMGGNTDIWIKQLPDGPFERLTFDEQLDMSPFWSADGQFVLYSNGDLTTSLNPWRRRSDATGTPVRLLDDNSLLAQGRLSPDGEWLVGRTLNADPEARNIMGFRADTDSALIPLVATDEFGEQGPALSPDGHWLAYSSTESGREEVYVRPFPNPDSGRWAISTSGGSNPRWAHNGNELFFVDADRSMNVARVETAPGFRVTDREVLFALGPDYVGFLAGDGGDDFYDVAPNDQRFLMARFYSRGEGEDGGTHILVQNFFEELKAKVGN